MEKQLCINQQRYNKQFLGQTKKSNTMKNKISFNHEAEIFTDCMLVNGEAVLTKLSTSEIDHIQDVAIEIIDKADKFSFQSMAEIIRKEKAELSLIEALNLAVHVGRCMAYTSDELTIRLQRSMMVSPSKRISEDIERRAIDLRKQSEEKLLELAEFEKEYHTLIATFILAGAIKAAANEIDPPTTAPENPMEQLMKLLSQK